MFLITDAIGMIRQIRSQEGPIGKWGGLLNMTQIIGGLIFIMYPEGLAILLAVLLTLAIAGQIHKRDPFSRLVGICHWPWLFLLPWLIYRLTNFDHPIYLKVWIGVVVILIAISLIFDVIDLWRYSRGDKHYAWAAKSGTPESGTQ